MLARARATVRLGCATEALRHALNSLAVVAPEWLRDHSSPEWAEQYGRRTDESRFPSAAEERQAYVQLYASYADAMVAAARRAKQGIVFVWEPGLAPMEGVKPLSDEERWLLPYADGTPEKTAQFEASRQAFHRLFDEAGVPVIDPTEALKTHPATVFIDYVHYTPDGNRFVAEVAYKQLRDMLLTRLKRQ